MPRRRMEPQRRVGLCLVPDPPSRRRSPCRARLWPSSSRWYRRTCQCKKGRRQDRPRRRRRQRWRPSPTRSTRRRSPSPGHQRRRLHLDQSSSRSWAAGDDSPSTACESQNATTATSRRACGKTEVWGRSGAWRTHGPSLCRRCSRGTEERSGAWCSHVPGTSRSARRRRDGCHCPPGG